MILLLLPLTIIQGKTPLSVGEGKGVRLLKQATGKECSFDVLPYEPEKEAIQKRMMLSDFESRHIELLAYPNPTSSTLKVSVYIPENFSNPELSIHDLTGRKYEQVGINNLMNQLEINTDNYPNGLYLLQVKTFNSIKAIRVSIIK